MPHVNSSGGDDLASTDEVKVYKDEGEEEKRSSENLSEDKLGLVTETEEDKQSDLQGNGYEGSNKSGGSQDGKPSDSGPDRPGGHSGYLFAPYAYANGSLFPQKASIESLYKSWEAKLGKPSLQAHPGALSPLMMYNDHPLASPPPAHMGIPPVHIDPKTGLPRPMYALPPPPGQFPHPLYSPEFSQMQWGSAPGYPITSGAFRGPYPSSLTSSTLARFSPPGMLPHHPSMHPGLPHHAIITAGPKQELHNSENHRNGHGSFGPRSVNGEAENRTPEKKRPYVKKPLNAFMLFMKEQRQKVIEEGTLKESAAINQILGRKWHALDRSEQAKYYEMARKEKELHMQLYPGWSARDSYATHTKKKKRKREPTTPTPEQKADGQARLYPIVHSPGQMDFIEDCTNAKKCRARFGVDAQNQWCKPCRRKKKCIRFMGGDDDGMSAATDDDDASSIANVSSVATVDSTTSDMDGHSVHADSPAPSAFINVDDSVQNPIVSSQTSSSTQLSSSEHSQRPATTSSRPGSTKSEDTSSTYRASSVVDTTGSLAASTVSSTAILAT